MKNFLSEPKRLPRQKFHLLLMSREEMKRAVTRGKAFALGPPVIILFLNHLVRFLGLPPRYTIYFTTHTREALLFRPSHFLRVKPSSQNQLAIHLRRTVTLSSATKYFIPTHKKVTARVLTNPRATVSFHLRANNVVLERRARWS